MIYPFWLLLLFRSDFLLSAATALVGLVLLAVVDYLFPRLILLVVGLMSALVVWFLLRWATTFLIRMIVDYDANEGNGRVILQRLLPHPTLPEVVQFPLQQAAEGSPEVNTKGIFNTLITQIKWLKFLRPLTIGDLTLRGPAAPFGITMYGIQDPNGVRLRLDNDWKKIAAIKNRQKAEKERHEEIERMTIAVAQGLLAAGFRSDLKVKDESHIAKARQEAEKQIEGTLIPPASLPTPTPPDIIEPMEYTPVSALHPEDIPGAKRNNEPENPGNQGEDVEAARREPSSTENNDSDEEADDQNDNTLGSIPRGTRLPPSR